MHQLSMGTGHPNVVKLEGVVRTSSDELLIAMEVAPRGTIFEVGKTIDQAVKDGQISVRSANLMRMTLFQDMVKGMLHFQETRGMSHVDVKGPNFIIGPNGDGKLSDFGTAGVDPIRGFSIGGTSKWPIDNPGWVAPEVYIEKEKVQDKLKAEKKLLNTELQVFKEDVQRRVANGELPAEDGKALIDVKDKSTKAQLKHLEENTFFQVSQKGDTWGVGITAFELFTGEKPLGMNQESFLFAIEKKLQQFGSDYGNRVRGQDKGTDSEGVTGLDRILNRMLHPDPEQRPSLNDVFKAGLFQEEGVSSQEVRDLIQALTDKPSDPEKIKIANEKLG
jgi:serine/threonine protein kinase